MDKNQLREQLRAARLAMAPSEAANKSESIINMLVDKLDFDSIASMHCYVPMARLNEVNTWPLLKYLWINYPNILTAVPTARRRGKYESIKVNQATRWRGLLPGSRIATPADFKFDLVIVPTLAFDDQLYRLGWGGGFYDRFLANQPRALKVGLCFKNGHINKIPAESHDIKLDMIVSEQGIID